MVMNYGEVFPKDLMQLENTKNWVSMVKVDGDNFQIKCKSVINTYGKKRYIRLVNRHNNDYTQQFPEIVAGLGVKKGVNCVLNGEIAYWNEDKQIFDFNLFRGRQGLQNQRKILQRRIQYPCKAYIFDLIELDGVSMVNNPLYPFKRRYELLKGIVLDNNVTELLPIRYDLIEHFKEEAEAGREGVMIKNLNNIYVDGRTDNILKCKNWHYSDIKFTGFEENNAGITLTNEQGDRVLVAGKKAELVKATIVQLGYSVEKIRHLQTRTENNRLREPTHIRCRNVC